MARVITPSLVKLVYDAAAMQRWNEYPRMVELTELDKQAHKFIIAYLLTAYETDIDPLNLIEAGMFEFFRRVVVTDIRPDVFREVIQEKGPALNAWVMEQLAPAMRPVEGGAFFQRMERYLADPDYCRRERKLMAAAHYLATRWEFQIVYQSSRFLHDVETLRASVEGEMSRFRDCRGAMEYCLNGKLSRLVDLNGRLRFQIRWAQTPRLPRTSVLGHVLVVALMTYFYASGRGFCPRRVANNFFCALFHDLPEALTRDIVSPVKRSVAGLDELILEVEIRKVQEEILPLVPDSIRSEFLYLMGIYEDGGKWHKDEFQTRICRGGRPEEVPDAGAYNSHEFSPLDGRAVKACDDLAAFSEAAISLGHGIRSRELMRGMEKILRKYEGVVLGGCDLHAVLQTMKTELTQETG